MAIQKLPVKKLVEFRRLSKSQKTTFTNRLKVAKKSVSDGGGNYWVRSISAISGAFRENDKSHITDKIDEVSALYNLNKTPQVKNMYRRNIEILEKYIDFDFSHWMPSPNLTFLSKPKSVLDMNGLPIQILPQHIFSYGAKNNKCIGGIWLVVWQEGFKPSDLGIYSEALYRFLSSYYSEDYIVNPSACMTIDIANIQVVGYDKILSGDIPSTIDETMKSLKEYL
ncbi:hypothetical protein ABV409_08780 [Flagellimonas sp. DF-77]|uniref:hypothetical protein n=1 Tax=Flagellimonas algarum TaxID=3230298 RepID=UPI00339AD8F6